MIDTIFFDWGGVLIENPTPHFVAAVSKRLNISQKQFIDSYRKVAYQFERGLLAENKMWDMIADDLKVNFKSQNHSIWYHTFAEVYKPQKDVFTLASKLDRLKYKVSLLSNTEIPAMGFFLEQNYYMLKDNTFSCAEGVAKPQPEIYLKALRKNKTTAEKSVFIDDKPENINAALQLGMNALLYINYPELITALNSFGIKV